MMVQKRQALIILVYLDFEIHFSPFLLVFLIPSKLLFENYPCVDVLFELKNTDFFSGIIILIRETTKKCNQFCYFVDTQTQQSLTIQA